MRNFTRAGSITLAAILAVGAFALSAPAYADDTPAATQEVASSPDTLLTSEQSPEPATSPSATTRSGEPGAETPNSTTDKLSEASADASIPPTGPNESSPTSSSMSEGGASSDSTPASPSETVSAPASASIVSDDTTEVFWAMPNGGTPDNITWPQTLSGADKLECGVWYQVDTYPLDDVAALTADGRLDLGEDYPVVISWRFVYGGDCPPAPGPANPKASIQSACGSADVEVENPGDNILTASVVIYVDGAFNQALAVAAGDHQTVHLALPEGGTVTVRTGPAFGDEQLATTNVEKCAVVVPPAETPTATPTPSTPPAAAPAPLVQTVAAPVVTTGELAETGSNSDRPLILGIIAAAIILLAIILIAVGRGRVHAEHERQQRAKLRK